MTNHIKNPFLHTSVAAMVALAVVCYAFGTADCPNGPTVPKDESMGQRPCDGPTPCDFVVEYEWGCRFCSDDEEVRTYCSEYEIGDPGDDCWNTYNEAACGFIWEGDVIGYQLEGGILVPICAGFSTGLCCHQVECEQR